MSSPPAILAEPVDAAPAGASPALLERQLRLLEELAGFGLEVAGAAAARACEPEADLGAAAMAYARASRAVRQAVMLQARLVKDGEERTAAGRQAVADAEARADAARQERVNQRKCQVSWILERVAKAGHDDRGEVERLAREADDRLDDDGLIGDVLSRPVSEVVADICRDLGLDPDWTRLAEEAWAKAERAGGEVGWPLLAFPVRLDRGRGTRDRQVEAEAEPDPPWPACGAAAPAPTPPPPAPP